MDVLIKWKNVRPSTNSTGSVTGVPVPNLMSTQSFQSKLSSAMGVCTPDRYGKDLARPSKLQARAAYNNGNTLVTIVVTRILVTIVVTRI